MKRLFIAFAWIGVFASLAAMDQARAQEKGLLFYGAQFEEFEYRRGDEDEDLLSWDGNAFVGSDELKLRWLGEGEYDLDKDDFERLENRLVLQIPVSTFFDVRGGVRLDTPKGADRWYGVVGVAGLAPQWLETGADFFVSETGDTSARLEVEYELLLTNYLILIPKVEVNMAFSDDREIAVGSGISDIEAGLRLSYDLIDRAVSPYLGFVYERKFGQTADFARDENEDVEAWRLVLGAKLMF
ncbi:MAG: copper resistance protein B [Proteobacteria bacterium]|nr:copper resistance protein B [Pseudomonadota bacterium]